jgi:hypothetical protein
VQFNVHGVLSSAAVAEGASATVQEWTSTAATAQIGKRKVLLEVTDEAEVSTAITPQMLNDSALKALVEGVDTDILDLASGFSTSVGTTNTTGEPADIFEAIMLMTEDKIPGPFKAILAPKAVQQMQNFILSSAAPVYSTGDMPSTLQAFTPRGDNWAGKIGVVDIYWSTLVEFSSPDDLSLIFRPELAYGLALWDSKYPGGVKAGAERGKSGATDGATYQEVSIFFATTEIVDNAGVQLISVS